jgi:hypothetical protein
MKSKTLNRILMGLVLAGLVGIIFLLALFFINLPSISSQLPPGSTPLNVNLFLPENGSRLPSGAYASVQAEALGVNPITTVQFWVDGIAVAASNAGEGINSNTLNANWSWLPASDGAHILVARAEDGQGNVGVSNPVRVMVTAQGSDRDPAADAQPDLPDISISNNPNTQPQPGLPTAPPVPGPGQFSPPPSGGNNPLPIWFAINFHLLTGVQNTPLAPQVAVAVNNCDVNLYIYDKSQDENGFFVYRMDAGDSSFNRIATLAASNGPVAFLYVDAGLSGTSLYYVASFNGVGESAGNIVQADVVGPSCASAAPQGPQFSNPKMTVSQPMDQVYCYISFDSSDWARIPKGMDSFIFPNAQGEFDLSPYLGSLSSAPITQDTLLLFECWGWSGGALQDLGKAQTTLKPGQSGPLTISGDKFQLVVNLLDLPGPTPPGSGGGIPTPDKTIEPPWNVQWTTDGSVCTKHSSIPVIFALLCDGAVKTNKVIVIWTWPPYICFPGQDCNIEEKVDGYRVYNSWTGALVDTISDQKQTVSILPSAPANNDPFHPKTPPCFFVEAFKGDKHSVPSDPACLPSQSAMKHLTLNPIETVTSKWEDTVPTDDSNCGTGSASDFYPDHKKLTAGYEHQSQSTDCADYYHSYIIARAQFDLGATGIGANKLLSATLHTTASNKVADNGVVNCAWHVNPVTAILGVLDGHENLVYDDYSYSIPGQLLDVDVPVTSFVKAWLQSAQPGQSNKPSFALFPPYYGNNGNNSCLADYSVSLELVYYP